MHSSELTTRKLCPSWKAVFFGTPARRSIRHIYVAMGTTSPGHAVLMKGTLTLK